jgi:small subunit ribosomal protein S1
LPLVRTLSNTQTHLTLPLFSSSHQTPTDEFIGQKLQVKFLDVDKETTRLVVSHRKAVVDAQIHDLSVGSVLKGVVTAVKPYGAFVDVGGMSGLLHISQISCDHISNVESVIPVGTQVCV